MKATECQVPSPEPALKHRAKPSPALPALINVQLGERQELPNDSRLQSGAGAFVIPRVGAGSTFDSSGAGRGVLTARAESRNHQERR